MKFSHSEQFVIFEGLIQTVQAVLSLGIKRLWLENDHTTPTCPTKVKNEWRCNSIRYLCTFMACKGTKVHVILLSPSCVSECLLGLSRLLFMAAKNVSNKRE